MWAVTLDVSEWAWRPASQGATISATWYILLEVAVLRLRSQRSLAAAVLVVLVLNGHNDDKIKTATPWLELIPTLPNVKVCPPD